MENHVTIKRKTKRNMVTTVTYDGVIENCSVDHFYASLLWLAAINIGQHLVVKIPRHDRNVLKIYIYLFIV